MVSPIAHWVTQLNHVELFLTSPRPHFLPSPSSHPGRTTSSCRLLNAPYSPCLPAFLFLPELFSQLADSYGLTLGASTPSVLWIQLPCWLLPTPHRSLSHLKRTTVTLCATLYDDHLDVSLPFWMVVASGQNRALFISSLAKGWVYVQSVLQLSNKN